MIAPKYEISDFFRWCPSRDAKLFSWVCKETNKCHPFCNADKCFGRLPRPTQSIMYVPSQVNRSQKCILLIVQYKYIKSFSGDFYSPESDRTRLCGTGFITQPSCVSDFHLTESVRWKWIVLAVYQFWKGISAGPALKYFTWFIGAGGGGGDGSSHLNGLYSIWCLCGKGTFEQVCVPRQPNSTLMGMLRFRFRNIFSISSLVPYIILLHITSSDNVDLYILLYIL